MSDYDDTRYDDEWRDERRRRGTPPRLEAGQGSAPVPNRPYRHREPPSARWGLEDDADLFGPDPDFRPFRR